MYKNTTTKDTFDFEIGYLTKSPCIECTDKENYPKCFDACRILDKIRSTLAGGISSTYST